MTKKQMLEKLQEEYNGCYNAYLVFKENGDEDAASRWWNTAFQTEHIIHMLFGDDIDVFHTYLNSK